MNKDYEVQFEKVDVDIYHIKAKNDDEAIDKATEKWYQQNFPPMIKYIGSK